MAPFYVASPIAESAAASRAANMVAQGYDARTIREAIRDRLPNYSAGRINTIYNNALRGSLAGEIISGGEADVLVPDNTYRKDNGLHSNYEYTVVISWNTHFDTDMQTRLFNVSSANPLTLEEIRAAIEDEAPDLITDPTRGYVAEDDYINTLEIGDVIDAARRP